MTDVFGHNVDIYSDSVLTKQGSVRIPVTGPNAGKLLYHNGSSEQIMSGGGGATESLRNEIKEASAINVGTQATFAKFLDTLQGVVNRKAIDV